MNLPGNQLLSGSAFSIDEDGEVCGCHSFDPIADFTHDGARSDERRGAVPVVPYGAERAMGRDGPYHILTFIGVSHWHFSTCECGGFNQALCHHFLSDSAGMTRTRRVFVSRRDPTPLTLTLCTNYPAGRSCSVDRQLTVERQSASVPNAIALQKRHMTSENPPLHSMNRHGFSELELNSHPRKQPPLGFY